MSTPATSTRGEFRSSLLGEASEETNTNTNFNQSQSNPNENISPIISTRDESFDHCLGNRTTSRQQYPIHKAQTSIIVNTIIRTLIQQ